MFYSQKEAIKVPNKNDAVKAVYIVEISVSTPTYSGL